MMGVVRMRTAGLSLIVMTTLLMTAVKSQPGPPRPHIVVTSLIQEPYLFETEMAPGEPKSVKEYSGFVKDLLDMLSDRVGFTYELSITDQYGSLNTNGTWNGMIGNLVNGSADLAVGALTMTSMRANVVDFGTPFRTFGRVAIVKRVTDVSIGGLDLGVRIGRLLSPLEDGIWLLSGLAWFVSSLILYIICRINPYEWRRMVMDREATLREGESFNCVNSYWFMLGAIFWQGFMRNPRSMGARIVITFWWLYALIFVSMYIASLTNYLRMAPHQVEQKTYAKIQTIQDIADNEHITLGVLKASATAAFLRHSQPEKYMKMWARITYDNTFENSIKAGIDKVRQSTRAKPYVFYTERSLAEQFVNKKPCDVYMIQDFPLAGHYAFAYSLGKLGGLKTKIDLNLMSLQENGALTALERKWFNRGKCENVNTPIYDDESETIRHVPFMKVDLASFSGALILLIIGLAMGSLVTVFEILIFKYAEKGNQDNAQEKQLMNDQNDKGRPGTSPFRDSGQPMTDV